MTLTEETVAALPGLDTVTVWAALVEPEFTSPNDRVDGVEVSGEVVRHPVYDPQRRRAKETPEP